MFKKYKYAVIATDVAIFTVEEGKLKILLIKMKKKPFVGLWAMPGGLIGPEESLEEAALRHLRTKSGVKKAYLEQLFTFGKKNRDPFGRVVSVAYMALISNKGLDLKTTREYSDVRWFPMGQLPLLAYDHKEIAAYALKRLRNKLEYSNVIYSLLPEKFTLSKLQKIYEIILDKKLDKRNFRKKFNSLNLIRATNEFERGGRQRPAKLYRFRDKEFSELKKFF